MLKQEGFLRIAERTTLNVADEGFPEAASRYASSSLIIINSTLRLFHHYSLMLIEAVAKTLRGCNSLVDTIVQTARLTAGEGLAGEVLDASGEAVLRHGTEELGIGRRELSDFV